MSRRLKGSQLAPFTSMQYLEAGWVAGIGKKGFLIGSLKEVEQ
jgi:hypothetical protein